ncbi:hypothetical protein [Bacteroides xylanisolvens]|uniref:hypothetical protein n=1 Tax=Bacteroides xylanisolvens TaxID=371601 RepID=UPI001BAB1694|nr:hypothetical protein [Bacteroides xylanisolvens]
MFGTVNIFFTGFIQAPGKRRKKTETPFQANGVSVSIKRKLYPADSEPLSEGRKTTF